MQTILIDVDTQHDFCHPEGALFVQGSDQLQPVFSKLTTWAIEKNIPVLGSVDSHAFDAWEFANSPEKGPNGEEPGFPAHCVKGTPGWLKVPGTLAQRYRFIPNVPFAEGILHEMVTKHQPQQLLLEKEVYSLFANPNAHNLLTMVLPPATEVRFIVYGVALDYCVKAAALGLVDYLKSESRSGEVWLVCDATASVVASQGEAALETCKTQGVKLVESTSILNS
jgi:nicotinamidase/pyrazinamidase